MLGGVSIHFEGCSEVILYFLFFSFTFTSCIPVLWPFDIYGTYLLIYIYDVCFFTYLPICCFFSLFIHMFLYVCNLYFCFTLRCLDEFCLKCFRKTNCENLSCHELSSCKIFQEFMLGLDLFCNSTNGYKFSDLRLLSWLICLLWFCHELPKGEIVRDIFDVIG